ASCLVGPSHPPLRASARMSILIHTPGQEIRLRCGLPRSHRRPPGSTGGTMPPLDEKPFRSEKESEREPAEIRILMGHPRVRPHVVPATGKTGELTKHDFVTSFLVAWQPS